MAGGDGRMAGMTARLDVLCAGYAGERVASTVVLIRDEDAVIVVDPGMVAGRQQILDPLARLGVDPASVSDVVFSHHHPDHTLNAALFEHARFHDFWAIYRDDVWTDRPADGFELSPSVRLMATPGHTAQDITTLVTAGEGLAACTHLWWSREGPADDPLAEDPAALASSRAKLLALAPALIVPGHGAPFAPSELPGTPG
jgi:glyoxylase-like metal-dependent hydrolase (beta-lactamase superfamily II)